MAGNFFYMITETCDCCHGTGILPEIGGDESPCMNCCGSGKLKYNKQMSIIIQTLEGPQLIVLTNLRIAHTYARRDSHALQLDYSDGSILRIPISAELSTIILETINKQINEPSNIT